VDDGAARHIAGMAIPALSLPSTGGGSVDLASWARSGLVLYVFPRMGPTEIPDPPGWIAIPGAYGCTQQSCAFRDRQARFHELGYLVAGLSAQPLDEQREAHVRLHLSFPLLADPGRQLGRVLGLPTFSVGDMTLYRRLTLVTAAGRIAKVFYPVFPPDENAEEVLTWLERRPK
ncbi:MAG TPA: peroxiredoxin, partial [Actinomycetota bacterium]|nr:peroxiredoxin [Actinomycetota bacterium]